MTPKRILAVSVLIVILILLVFFIAQRGHYVDTNAATAAGAEYFTCLEKGRVADAMLVYMESFRKQQGENWPRFLQGLAAKYGPVTNYTLDRWQIVPIDGVGCVLLSYRISRGALGSQEDLILCPEAVDDKFAIVGHEMTRLDTQQKVSAGITIVSKGINIP
jgi:hypothetical protein